MHGSRTFCQRGPKCHLKLTTIGLSAKRLWNGVLLACQWPTIECWLGSFVIFRGSGSILLGNPIFCDFSEGPDPLSPSGFAHGMHLKEGTCRKCSVIIGRKVGLDYNSWYACLSLIRHIGRSSGFKLFANFDRQVVKGEREREKEREETARCLRTNLLFWLVFLEYRNAMFGSVNQLPMRTQNSNRLLYGKVGHSTVLTLCVLSIACTHF